MKTINVLSVDIAAATRGLLLDEVADLLRGTEARVIGKVPSEFLVRSLGDPDFGAYLRATHFNVADGIGVLWAARFLTLRISRVKALGNLQILWQAGYSLASLVLSPRFCRYPIPERIRGLDALFTMLEAAQTAGVSVYFLGARAEVNERAREEMKTKYPQLTIAGGHDGYSGDAEGIAREIDESGAGLLIVALGSPKQEYWIRANLHRLKKVRVAVGEGGTLDLIAGDYRLTPAWMQAVALEWLWRLLMHRSNKSGGTSRARRVWNAVPVFIYHVVQWKLAHGAVPLTERGAA
jgi:N-acetylglucosaminyldiphosphoundecaprenol N-acetyl-beta-D-mannosaminyltransferase